MSNIGKIVVIGLGYVGLPVAVALARKYQVTGFDIDVSRIAELRAGHDRTREIDGEKLAASHLTVSENPDDCRGADIYIVTVPTPVDDANQPDLTAVCRHAHDRRRHRSGEAADDHLRQHRLPGLPKTFAAASSSARAISSAGRDFGSATHRRHQPGTARNSIDRITRSLLPRPRSARANGRSLWLDHQRRSFRAASIKAAEAAKPSKRPTRLNIAFMNEVAQILSKIEVSCGMFSRRREPSGTSAVRARPGRRALYRRRSLLPRHLAQQLGHDPRVILSGRRTNDDLGCGSPTRCTSGWTANQAGFSSWA